MKRLLIVTLLIGVAMLASLLTTARHVDVNDQVVRGKQIGGELNSAL